VTLAAGMFTLVAAFTAKADVAFRYDPISDPILSATFFVDFAEMVANRKVGGIEVNWARLVDVTTGLPDFDLSDDLFGTAGYPNPPLVNMASQETGIIPAPVDPGFFPALKGGQLGVSFAFTDTNDGLFAIDDFSIEIVTGSGTINASYGEPNGYGLGIPDGGPLPGPLLNVLPPGTTGTGYDESISGKGGNKVPVPGSMLLGLLGFAGLSVLRRRCNRGSTIAAGLR